MSKVSGYVTMSHSRPMDLATTELAFLLTLQQLSERQDGVTLAFAFCKPRGNETHCCLSEVVMGKSQIKSQIPKQQKGFSKRISILLVISQSVSTSDVSLLMLALKLL